METIFDHNPTSAEISKCYFASFVLTKVPASKVQETYLSEITKDKAIHDIAMLLELRGQNAFTYWLKIPELYNEHLLGFDNEQIPV